jgi:hypothetical protein
LKHAFCLLPLTLALFACEPISIPPVNPNTAAQTSDNSFDATDRIIYLRTAPKACIGPDSSFPAKIPPTLSNLLSVNNGILLPSDLPMGRMAAEVANTSSFLSPVVGEYFLTLNNNNTESALNYLNRLERRSVQCWSASLDNFEYQIRVLEEYPFGATVPTSGGPVQREQKLASLRRLIGQTGTHARLQRAAYNDVRVSIRSLPQAPTSNDQVAGSSQGTTRPAPISPQSRTLPDAPPVTAPPTKEYDDFFERIPRLLGTDCRAFPEIGCT